MNPGGVTASKTLPDVAVTVKPLSLYEVKVLPLPPERVLKLMVTGAAWTELDARAKAARANRDRARKRIYLLRVCSSYRR